VAARSHTVGSILRRQAAARGARPVLVCDDDRLSYSDAERRSARLARGLIALGAGKGTHVGLLYPNGGEFVAATLAAARIGAVVIPYTTFATTTRCDDARYGRDLRHDDGVG
jgi:acyl-CoA synthetase (AMP-forming)/AMP-acid ligase II